MKRLPELVLLLLLVSFFYTRLPSTEYNRVIHSDGKGYYAHLPALFIYNDLTYDFADDVEKKYYPSDGSLAKHFRFTFKGEIVNKTFSGITILWLPFFLLAHLLTLLLGWPADGYSMLYQLSIGISAIFYAWVGCIYLIRLLESFKFSKTLAGISFVFITLGTNYLYYVLFDPSLTHTYSFTLIAMFFYYSRCLVNSASRKHLILVALIFGLILTIRPQNGFVLFALPFMLWDFASLKTYLTTILGKIKNLITALVPFLMVISVPIALWYLQTGYFLVYSYGEERFVFSNPQFFNVLFSYKKGLFVYSPIVFISLFGLFPVFRKNTFAFFSLLGFFAINTYIISSWEEWWYGCSYGHRVFIDFYSINAVILAFFLKSISKSKIGILATYVAMSLLMVFNWVQVFQHYTSVVPSCDNNKEMYWHNFIRLTPEARVEINKELMLTTSSLNNFEDNNLVWKSSQAQRTNEQSFSGDYSNKIHQDNPFSATFKGDLKIQDKELVVSAVLLAIDDINPRLIIETYDSLGTLLDYKDYFLGSFLKTNSWIQGSWSYKRPNRNINSQYKVYFWLPDSKSALYIDDIKVDVYSVKSE